MGIDATHFILSVEETLDVEIPDNDWWQFVTVGDLCDYIVQKTPGADPAKVFETVRRIAANAFSLDPEHVQPTARWIEDLKVD